MKQNHDELIEIIDSIWKLAPELRRILREGGARDRKRTDIALWLQMMQNRIGRRHLDVDAEVWHLCRDCGRVFNNMIQHRNEKLAGFSFLDYLGKLAKTPPAPPPADLSRGFLMELQHLVQGIVGKPPDFYEHKKYRDSDKYTGREAALIRSDELDTMAEWARNNIGRFPSGLDQDVIRRRTANRARILKALGAGLRDWNDWRWQVENVIRDADTLARLIELTDEERRAIALARKKRIPFGVTPYYVSLMDRQADRSRDHAVRAQVIPSLHYVETVSRLKGGEQACDFMLEHDTSPVGLVTRRYPCVLILKPVNTCPQICVYCQRNWEITDVLAPDAVAEPGELDRAVDWIREHPGITEVLVTGGDPLLLDDDGLIRVLERLETVPSLRRIRIGTRTFVTMPMRFTAEFVRRVAAFHKPGKRELMFVTHFEHAYESSTEALKAVQSVRRKGMGVYNQMVFTVENARRFEAVALRVSLRLMGVDPYYTFNTKGKAETKSFRVPIARLLQEQKEEARLMPGCERTDEVVYNVPAMGKNYLKSWQNHDIISITPDGRRLYEFHPWEKYLVSFSPYLDADVPILDFIEELERRGEVIEDYNSIWYYF